MYTVWYTKHCKVYTIKCTVYSDMPDKSDTVTTQHDTVDTCRPTEEVVFTLQMVDRSTEGPIRGQEH